MKIGVFVCHCGSNIAGTVAVDKVADAAKEFPHVAVATHYKYMCSEPGQAMIVDAIKKHGLDRVVVAACSPTLHERTFRRCVEATGINPFLCELANIREHCSWVHPREDSTTEKAADIVRLMVSRASMAKPLTRLKVPIRRKALVIGGGLAGIRAALDISSAGHEVVLVEKSPELGGYARQIKHAFPSLRTIAWVDTLLETLATNPLVTIHTFAEVEAVEGYVGNFRVRIRKTDSQKTIEDECGAIVAATGLSVSDANGYLRHPDVVNSLAFENMLASGRVARPSDQKEARRVVFVQCADLPNGDVAEGAYCSRICCMVTAKQALLFADGRPDAEAYVFTRDVVVAGKDYEQFMRRVQEHPRVLYLSGRVTRVAPSRDGLTIVGEDGMLGVEVEIGADLVVLANRLVPREDAASLSRILGIPYDKNHFFTELHAKLAPVETVTTGVYVAGSCHFPKDIPDTLASGSAAAAKVLVLFGQPEYSAEPTVARVNQSICNGCYDCQAVCTFKAIEALTVRGRRVARVIETMCHGCGNCVSACRPGAIDLAGFDNEQILVQIEHARR